MLRGLMIAGVVLLLSPFCFGADPSVEIIPDVVDGHKDALEVTFYVFTPNEKP